MFISSCVRAASALVADSSKRIRSISRSCAAHSLSAAALEAGQVLNIVFG
jgi:hypothetical protein